MHCAVLDFMEVNKITFDDMILPASKLGTLSKYKVKLIQYTMLESTKKNNHQGRGDTKNQHLFACFFIMR